LTNVKTIPNDIVFASVEELIAEGETVELRVKGFSMTPFLRSDRDVVKLAPLPAGGLRRGMVVLFRHNGKFVLHRLCRIESDELVFAGDGNYRTEEHARLSDAMAYVAEVEKHGGRRFAYDSAEWRLRTSYSLKIKLLKTIAIYIKRTILK